MPTGSCRAKAAGFAARGRSPSRQPRIGTFFNGSFACDDVTATYRQLNARGVEFVSGPEKQPWGECAVFKDPDGNQFVLSSS